MSYASSEGSSLIPSFILPPSISVNTISPIAPSTTVNFTGSGGITADEFVGASVISTTVEGIISCGYFQANNSVAADTLSATGNVNFSTFSCTNGLTVVGPYKQWIGTSQPATITAGTGGGTASFPVPADFFTDVPISILVSYSAVGSSASPQNIVNVFVDNSLTISTAIVVEYQYVIAEDLDGFSLTILAFGL